VRGAHLPVVQWARAKGIGWGLLTVEGARELMEEEELDEESPLCRLEEEYAHYAAIEHAQERQGMVDSVLHWLQANGCLEVGDAEEEDEEEEESEGESEDNNTV